MIVLILLFFLGVLTVSLPWFTYCQFTIKLIFLRFTYCQFTIKLIFLRFTYCTYWFTYSLPLSYFFLGVLTVSLPLNIDVFIAPFLLMVFTPPQVLFTFLVIETCPLNIDFLIGFIYPLIILLKLLN